MNVMFSHNSAISVIQKKCMHSDENVLRVKSAHKTCSLSRVTFSSVQMADVTDDYSLNNINSDR